MDGGKPFLSRYKALRPGAGKCLLFVFIVVRGSQWKSWRNDPGDSYREQLSGHAIDSRDVRLSSC
jgi:hypothetical protein